MFDLNLYPISIHENQEQTELPGFAAFNAPRRAARGRTGDQLIVLFSTPGTAPLSTESIRQIIDRLAPAYFQTAGSVTIALRTVTELVNQALLDRNQKTSAAGKQAYGLLNLAVIHGQSLYLAHSGATHSFLISAGGVQHFNDPQPLSRGLGLGKTLPLRFYQTEIHAGDRLLLCLEAPSTWRADSLNSAFQYSDELLCRRILTPRPAEIIAGLLQMASGTGAIKRIVAQYPAGEILSQPIAAGDTIKTQAPLPVSVPADQAGPETAPEPKTPLASALENQPTSAPLDVLPEPVPVRPPRVDRAAPPPSAPSRQPVTPATEKPRPEKSTQKSSLPFLQAVSKFLHGEQRFRQVSRQSIKEFFQRVLPGKSGETNSLSSGTMVFLAVAVPIIIVVSALIIYNQRGRKQQYQDYLTLAVQSAMTTQTQTDVTTLKETWTETLAYLDKADQAMPDQAEAVSLRQQAQDALDKLDAVVRLPFQPAVTGGFSSTVNITQMVATSTDLYLLNSVQNKVIRATLTGGAYEVDTGFNCGSSQTGAISVGTLVDIAAPPKSNAYNASILAIDDIGNILLCTPGDSPTPFSLVQPELKWGKITAITIDSTGMYILDAANSAIWLYSDVEDYTESPSAFIKAGTTPLTDAVDLAVNGDDLLLLHADGLATLCTKSYDEENPMTCNETSPYSDGRSGQSINVTTFANTTFTQLLYTQPPDPSYYILDTTTPAVYHFSLRLNLQRLLETLAPPDNNFPDKPATAFTISPNRLAFIAFGNEVFVGQMP